uniref:PIN domain-containing protein n=1 Tax=Candidatus Kentrum sp. FW TaxID=2126338 RepID=A0A450T5J3_9GAMM|nr:MAG: PIN domain-containing protein [Candidatus Kentron sp. FW]VFJ61997.1 MAG: PIN domain-containing protein [Candidatus Kentron sp. FW]
MSVKSLDKYVLDTSALMALIGKEEGAETVRDLLERASGKENRIFISTVTAIEIFGSSRKSVGRFRDSEITKSMI